MIESLHQGLQEDGVKVSISQLCNWFGLVCRVALALPFSEGAFQTASTLCRKGQSVDRGRAIVWISDRCQLIGF